MKKELLNLLKCPACGHDEICIEHIYAKYFLDEQDKRTEFIKEGLLKCPKCNMIYPIIDDVPTLLRESQFIDSEKAFCQNYDKSRETVVLDYTPMTEAERLEKIKAHLLQYPFYREETYSDENSKKWIRSVVEYEVKYAHLKEKYLRTLETKLKKRPSRILDIGGGQAGAIHCLQQEFKPKFAILLDMDDRFTPIAKLRNDHIDVIRGDGTNMPFKNKSIDLTISNGCMEHVPAWQKMLAEIKRVGTETYLSYTPNGSFPWEIGHLRAPLVPIVPKPIARKVCYYWHRLLNNKHYDYNLIDHILSMTFFVPSRKFQKEIKKLGMQYQNMLYQYALEAMKASYHFHYGKYVKILGRFPFILKSVIKTVTLLHLEPVVHYYLYHEK
ncbi:methyltransferase domain-containing protein [candidate division KSB1 bacterium]|nr:methyltransferase domain-containing protein [candidate division KSB1 bacterium]